MEIKLRYRNGLNIQVKKLEVPNGSKIEDIRSKINASALGEWDGNHVKRRQDGSYYMKKGELKEGRMYDIFSNNIPKTIKIMGELEDTTFSELNTCTPF
ncbi:MAG: hypothetical protein HQ538_01825 [Parcubacteria group bacterium]|nr:hypothetical protein [Parcubacteria group bacterium]